MSKSLSLSPDFSLPLGAITESIAIVAKRRVGKSYLMRRFVEQCIKAKQQIVLIDPKGDQWGICFSADGNGPGLPVVILGGEHAHVPLEPTGGELVAQLVVEDRVSVLIDLCLFRKHQVATFMAHFLETLYRLKAKEEYRTPMMLVIDEADAIAPQNPKGNRQAGVFDNTARMLGAAEDIVRRGGQRGIGCLLVTQRSAVLNKNVLTQAQVLISLRTIAPQDIKALEAWIDVHGTADERKVLLESLPTLPVGDAWIWSPGWPTEKGIFQRIHVSPIETFDSAATPKPGEKIVEPKNPADVDLAAFEKRMAATIEKVKADDPKELRKEIAELKRQLTNIPKQVDQAAIDKAVSEAVAAAVAEKDDRIKHLEFICSEVEQIGQRLTDVAGDAKVHDVMHRVNRWAEREDKKANPPAPPKLRVEEAQPKAIESIVESRPATNGEVTGPGKRILQGLGDLVAIGITDAPRMLTAFMAGYGHPNSKGFTNALGTLRSAGYIDYPVPGRISVTTAGLAECDTPSPPRSLADLHERVLAFFPGVQERVVRALLDSYPDPLPRADLAEKAGYGHVNSKGFTNTLGKLRTLGLLDYPSTGQVVASDILFPEELS